MRFDPRWLRWFRLRAIHIVFRDRASRISNGDETPAYRASLSLAVGLLFVLNSLVRRPPDDELTSLVLERVSLVRRSSEHNSVSSARSEPTDDDATFNPFERGLYFVSALELTAAPRLWADRGFSDTEFERLFPKNYLLLRDEFEKSLRSSMPGTVQRDKPIPRNPNQHPGRPNLLSDEQRLQYDYAPVPDFGLDDLDIALPELAEASVGEDIDQGVRAIDPTPVGERTLATTVAYIIGLFTAGIYDRAPNSKETGTAQCCLTVEEIHRLDWKTAFLTLDLSITFAEVYVREYKESKSLWIFCLLLDDNGIQATGRI